MMIRVFAMSLVLFGSCTMASAQLEEIAKQVKGIGGATNLSESQVGSGLKEALRVGAENAVKLTGKTDGYFGNAAIKILLPKNLRPLEQALAEEARKIRKDTAARTTDLLKEVFGKSHL